MAGCRPSWGWGSDSSGEYGYEDDENRYRNSQSSPSVPANVSHYWPIMSSPSTSLSVSVLVLAFVLSSFVLSFCTPSPLPLEEAARGRVSLLLLLLLGTRGPPKEPHALARARILSCCEPRNWKLSVTHSPISMGSKPPITPLLLLPGNYTSLSLSLSFFLWGLEVKHTFTSQPFGCRITT